MGCSSLRPGSTVRLEGVAVAMMVAKDVSLAAPLADCCLFAATYAAGNSGESVVVRSLFYKE